MLAGRTEGLDWISTTMTGVPVSTSASSRAICAPCSSSVAVDLPSPVRATVSPSTTTTQSACRALRGRPRRSSLVSGAAGRTAGPGLPVRVGLAGRVDDQPVPMSAPRACVMVQFAGAMRGSRRARWWSASRGCPSGIQWIWPEAPAQSPSWACWSSAFGTDHAAIPVAEARPSAPGTGRRKRQGAVVAEQHQGAARHLQVDRGVLGGSR